MSEEGVDRDDDDTSQKEQEEALVALIEYRTREIEQLKGRVAYYQSQLEQAEKKLNDSHLQLAHLRGRTNEAQSRALVENQSKSFKKERISVSTVHVDEPSSRSQLQSKTVLVIPSANLKISQPIKAVAKAPIVSSAQPDLSTPSRTIAKVKVEKSSSSDDEVVEVQYRGRKRKLEEKKQKELIQLVHSSSSPHTIHCHTSNQISSQHKRKLRSLALCPVNDQLFVTSALDGMVNLWQIQARGSGASVLSSTDCMSQKSRRWPEDIAWHPLENSLFSVYTADDGDSQISILNLNERKGKSRVTFLKDKPHVKGIINSIMFMPWEPTCFVTGGSDHAVIVWTEKDAENPWKPRSMHENMHSSAVMGVAGMKQKRIVLSAGADKKIIGYDVQEGKADFIHKFDSKCMSVLPNPCDFNLFMVQTGTEGKQIRLFDIRQVQTEIHSFGFKQESSHTQSALINQAWSPDGWYLSSGSVDPVIHIFDIRYNANKPSQSIRAHHRRVFKAEWHCSHPLLISISSDLHIGLHEIT